MSTFKSFLQTIAPHGLVELQKAKTLKRIASERAAFHAERRQKIDNAAASTVGATIRGDNRAEVFEFLKSRGLEESHLQAGSVPESSLEYIRDHAISLLDGGRPVIALHVGNFVGVSLAYLTAALKDKNLNSVVVSVDPNLTHRGITNPQSHVSALLSACGLQKNAMIVAAYSGQKSISNDGVVFGDYDPLKEFSSEFACEDALSNLSRINPGTFNLIMMDGNHEADYLVGEIQKATVLLKPGGVLVLDDVDATYWSAIERVFSQVEKFGFRIVGADGRIGIAQMVAAVPANR